MSFAEATATTWTAISTSSPSARVKNARVHPKVTGLVP
jgi:hypothetical protein